MLTLDQLSEMVGEGETGDVSDIRGNPLAKVPQQRGIRLGPNGPIKAPVVEQEAEPGEKPGKKQKKPVDLTEIEEFRKYQAEQDRKFAELTKRAENLETAYHQALARQASSEAERIKSAFLSRPGWADSGDAEALLQQLVEAEVMKRQGVRSEWDRAKAKALSDAGLSPELFPDEKYADEPSTAWYRFQADLHQARASNLAEELNKFKADLPNLVKQQMAQYARKSGLTDFDTGGPDSESGEVDEEWRADRDRVQAGTMSPQAYLKKWGGPAA